MQTRFLGVSTKSNGDACNILCMNFLESVQQVSVQDPSFGAGQPMVEILLEQRVPKPVPIQVRVSASYFTDLLYKGMPSDKIFRDPPDDSALIGIKEVLGFRRFSLRGEANARGEWNVVCLAVNLKRFHRIRMA